jgi:hypothetical protein
MELSKTDTSNRFGGIKQYYIASGIAGASYTDDLVLNNSTIQQTTNAGQINTLCATDFYSGDVRLSNNLTMIGGAGTIATLKNLIVVGTSQLGIITGTTITD